MFIWLFNEFQIIMSNVNALSFVPPGFTMEVFEKHIKPGLLELCQTNQSIKKFIEYVENTYVGKHQA